MDCPDCGPSAELAGRREAIDRLTGEEERKLRAVHGAALPERMAQARLPANEAVPGPLSEERRDTFRVNVSAAIDRAMDDPDRPFPETPESAADGAPLIQAACGACRGSCCKYGADHAYLYPDHFRRLLRDHPGRSREEILSDYLSRLPERAYRDSCVYHTETGCALPRERRSNLCNTFVCGGLEELVKSQSREPLPVLAFCIRDHTSTLVRTAVFDAAGRPILPVTKPAESSSIG